MISFLGPLMEIKLPFTRRHALESIVIKRVLTLLDLPIIPDYYLPSGIFDRLYIISKFKRSFQLSRFSPEFFILNYNFLRECNDVTFDQSVPSFVHVSEGSTILNSDILGV